jgi:hypothetical protein
MKRMTLCGLIVIFGIIFLAGCGTSSDTQDTENTRSTDNAQSAENDDPYETASSEWRAEFEDYISSQHDADNNLVYFFIKKVNPEANVYAFIITEEMEESEQMQCLEEYVASKDIVGYRYTDESIVWYNDYSPVVIQDDYNGHSVAAFSFPKDVIKIWIFIQNLTMGDNNIVDNKAFPLFDFELSEEPTQYYLLNAGVDDVNNSVSNLDRVEFENLFSDVTSYSTQMGTKFQPGYISGKGQGLQLAE